MQTQFESGLVWFRRDLRIDDNAALSLALRSCQRVFCAFLFDRDILDPLPRQDRRVEFIRESLVELDARLQQLSGKPLGGLICLNGKALDAIPELARQLGVQTVFAARDYEPAAQLRDAKVEAALAIHRIGFLGTKDHTIFEGREVLTQSNKPYTVFTPYKRAWLARLGEGPVPVHECKALASALAARPTPLRTAVPTLADLGFAPSNLTQLHISTGMSGGTAVVGRFSEPHGRIRRGTGFSLHQRPKLPGCASALWYGIHTAVGQLGIAHSSGRQRRCINLAG
jgi:deoxyribodipyrimidine photo-lyase